jgi:DNA-binding MarR family transcriptional regulator
MADQDEERGIEDGRSPRKAGAGLRRADRRLGLLPQLLGYRLRQAQIAVFEDFQRAMDGLDVTPGRFGVLEAIAANSGLSQSELGNILGIDRSTVVAVIDRLEAGDLVRRMKVATDRRSYALTLGERGRAIIDELRRRVLAHEQRIARNLSAAERQSLLDLLDRVARDA